MPGTTFADNVSGVTGSVRYMVRALKLQVGHSGSYYNLSQGAFGVTNVTGVITDCMGVVNGCLLYTSDAADERSSVDLGGRRIIKKKNKRERERERERKVIKKRRTKSER